MKTARVGPNAFSIDFETEEELREEHRTNLSQHGLRLPVPERPALFSPAEVTLRGATSWVLLAVALNYWTSFRTACWAWLDCCKAAMPVDCNTLYWVMLATVLPMSAF